MTRVHGLLDVYYVTTTIWVVHHPFVVDLECLGTRVTVPSGFVFDFNSIPWVFRRIAPPTDFGESGLVHDYLYRRDAVPNVKREWADAAHRELMLWKLASLPEALRPRAADLRVKAYYGALRAFAGGAFHKKEVAWKPSGIVLPNFS